MCLNKFLTFVQETVYFFMFINFLYAIWDNSYALPMLLTFSGGEYTCVEHSIVLRIHGRIYKMSIISSIFNVFFSKVQCVIYLTELMRVIIGSDTINF